MANPIRIFQSPFSERYYATRAYKIINAEKGLFEVTGQKDDVTDEIKAIIEREIAKRNQGSLPEHNPNKKEMKDG